MIVKRMDDVESMKETVGERLEKLASALGYSREELSAKGIEAMLEWIDRKDENQIPEFILEIRKKQYDLKRTR